jgi:L-serine dehydratase
MAVSVFDIFKIGIGPSSSHTVGPMRAARLFVDYLQDQQYLPQVARIQIYFYGSLGATGKGHGTDTGTLLGLMGHAPDQIDPNIIPDLLAQMRSTKTLSLLGQHPIAFTEKNHITFARREVLPEHPNGMKFDVFDANEQLIASKSYLSVGGGFVVSAGEPNLTIQNATQQLPYPFQSGEELLAMCTSSGLSIAQIMMHNELTWRTEQEVNDQLLHIWSVMQACVKRGCEASGPLPGAFNVRRRAPELHRQLTHHGERSLSDPLSVLDWINVYAMAVNEENACGGRVVTAPTNGAAGIIPAVLHYYDRFIPHANNAGIITFLLTAGAIGILYKLNASISGAEVGCQGEVGVACSMAAAALCAVTGGSVAQVENAAEIGMEHNLGLTCDPVGGLVQIPCIERNAMGATKALNAARMALRGDGTHTVSLDSVIKTMKETGDDMKTKYKETSRGGLAVNIVEC